ncbi:MAG TPA: isocitrate lyase/phosphoenolpyruvate mutase family protein [Alphaproteobacteria bacterium]|jgi:2-methylisocitrate lyase-like PEP mutase family enzyme
MAEKALIAKAERLKALHVPGRPLVLPNAWDAGSAKVIAAEGYPAVATTSAGIAFSYGVPDGEAISRADMLHATRRIAAAVAVPVTADVEAGYGAEPKNVAYTVMELLGAGVVGANFEDSSDAAGGALFDLELASARIAAGRQAARDAGVPFVINGRTDALMRIKDPAAAFAEAVKRLNAYRKAGADCLFAPFTADPGVIGRLVKAVDGPLNIILQPTITVAEMAKLGVARISLGGHVARAALAVARRAARELKEHGTAQFAREGLDYRELQKLMASRP